MEIEKIILNNGDELLIPLPQSYRDCLSFIKSDEYRKNGKMLSSWKIIKKNIIRPGGSLLFWFRLCQYRGRFFRIFCFLYSCLCKKANIYLPPMTRIGFGLDIGHGMCIVINGGTIIGNNVSLSHFVSIGTNDNTPAIIGNNVYIGPNSNLVENVSVGSNVTIGAGSVVTKDIPSNATTVGTPARVINYNNPARYIKNPYPLP